MNQSIRPVTLDDVVGLDRYEKDRDQIRRRIIALKKHRRVAVGDCVTFIFENHDTVFFQAHEMMRAERISDLDEIREELDVYNQMLPQPGELSATMMIEITDSDAVEQRLNELIGIDEHVSLRVGDETIPAQFEPGRSREDRLSAVQYVRFALSASAIEGFRSDAPVSICIDHENYQATASIDGETRQSLTRDLES